MFCRDIFMTIINFPEWGQYWCPVPEPRTCYVDSQEREREENLMMEKTETGKLKTDATGEINYPLRWWNKFNETFLIAEMTPRRKILVPPTRPDFKRMMFNLAVYTVFLGPLMIVTEATKVQDQSSNSGRYTVKEEVQKAPESSHFCNLTRTSVKISFPEMKSRVFVNFLGYKAQLSFERHPSVHKLFLNQNHSSQYSKILSV